MTNTDTVDKPAPDISIVITCHSRKDFLEEAIESALNQTIPRERYEILLVMDFQDTELEEYCRNRNVKIIFDNRPQIGVKIALGVEHSRGDLVCFLNDDDKFVEKKLEMISSVFNTNPSCSYVHNNSMRIDSYGKYIGGKTVSMQRSSIRMYGSTSQRSMAAEFKKNMMFNDSSVSIRRRDYLPFSDLFYDVYGNQDNIIFYVGMIASDEVLFLSDVLTLFRVHDSNTSTGKELEGHCQLLERRIGSLCNTFVHLSDHHNFERISNLLFSDAKSQYMQYMILKEHQKSKANGIKLYMACESKGSAKFIFTRSRVGVFLLYKVSKLFPALVKTILWTQITSPK